MNYTRVSVLNAVHAILRVRTVVIVGVLILIPLALLAITNVPKDNRLMPTATMQLPCSTLAPNNRVIARNKIAFSASTNWANHEICIMNPDGSNRYIVTDNARENHISSWSPDNERIAFESGIGWDTNVYLINIDGSNEVLLTHTNRAIGGNWSPDGKRIAFTEDNSPYPVHIVNIDGTHDVVLPPLDGNDRPRWSPDGRKLLFWSARNGNGVQIYTINADGTNPAQLTNKGFNINPSC